MKKCNRQRDGMTTRRVVYVAALMVIHLLFGGMARAQTSVAKNPETFPFTFYGPQAATAEELDAFGLILEASRPSEIIAKSEAFTQKFPDSQLLSLVQLREMKAEMDVNSYQGAVAVGHALLRRNANNLEALILLTGVLPNFPPSYPEALKVRALKEAQGDVQSANQLLHTFHVMEGFPSRTFLAEKEKLRRSLNEAAAYVDLASGDYARAIQEYQAIPPAGRDAVTYFRLGVAYYRAGQMEKARTQLQIAMQKDTGIIRQRAAGLLKQIAPKPAGTHPSPAGNADAVGRHPSSRKEAN